MVKPNILVLLSVLMLAVACGGAGKPEKFVFTPVPYTVYPAVGAATAYPVAIAPNGDRYIADRVVVQVSKDRREALERWARSLGFSTEALPDSALAPFSVVAVKVTVGSAPDAVELIRIQKGVQSVYLDYLAMTH